MMDFEKLLELQRELNEEIGAYPKTISQLAFALIEECGEVSRELRSKWRWWQWPGKTYTYDRTKVVEELVDVLKFCLVGLSELGALDFELDLAAADWNEEWPESMPDSIGISLASIPAAFIDSDPEFAILHLTRICTALGISKEEISAAYLEKWKQNKARLKK